MYRLRFIKHLQIIRRKNSRSGPYHRLSGYFAIILIAQS